MSSPNYRDFHPALTVQKWGKRYKRIHMCKTIYTNYYVQNIKICIFVWASTMLLIQQLQYDTVEHANSCAMPLTWLFNVEPASQATICTKYLALQFWMQTRETTMWFTADVANRCSKEWIPQQRFGITKSEDFLISLTKKSTKWLVRIQWEIYFVIEIIILLNLKTYSQYVKTIACLESRGHTQLPTAH